MQRLLEPMWEQVAPTDPSMTPPAASAKPSHETQLLRAEIAAWACKVHVDSCESWARRTVHLWRLQADPDRTNP